MTNAHLFEWMMRRLDGRDVPIEVSATAVLMGGRSIHVVICRDIIERKKAERELLELNQSLERRVTERAVVDVFLLDAGMARPNPVRLQARV
jgi:hypothetical protein